MNSSDQIKLLPIGILILSALFAFAWLLMYWVSNCQTIDGFVIVLVQSTLTLFVFAFLLRTSPRNAETSGPQLNFIIGLHVLIYYCLSNVIPTMLPELRAGLLEMRIPVSQVWAYSLASVAAGLMLIGIAVGCRLTSMLWPQTIIKASRQFPWLPNYNLAIRACLVILVLITVGTMLFGVQVGSETLLDEEIVSLSIYQKLIFHGLFTVLPIAPILAAASFAQADLPDQRRSAGWLLLISSLLTLSVLLIWGQRSTAMLALTLPMVLLCYTGKVNWRKTVLPAVGLMFTVYLAVTIVRDSYLLPLLATTDDVSQLSIGETVSAITTIRRGNQGVATRAFTDLSYRTAGLEGAASIIQAQSDGRLPLQMGKTILTGFVNALPAALRTDIDLNRRIKTAPSYFGIFQPGDWVTTILAEFVMDFGPVLLFLPAVLAGLVLSLIDRTLFGLGQRPVLEGLLILRIVFLLFIISNGGSLAEMTLMLFKATIGYTVIFLLLSSVSRVAKRLRSNHVFSVGKTDL